MININNLDLASQPKLILRSNKYLDKALSSKSYDFRLQNTPKNDSILNNLFSSSVGKQTSFEASYSLDGSVFFGVLFLTEINDLFATGTFKTGN